MGTLVRVLLGMLGVILFGLLFGLLWGAAVTVPGETQRVSAGLAHEHSGELDAHVSLLYYVFVMVGIPLGSA